MNFTSTEQKSQKMGNLIDSDSSASDVDVDGEAETEVHMDSPKDEVRTDGDGMESGEEKKIGLGLDPSPPSVLTFMKREAPWAVPVDLNMITQKKELQPHQVSRIINGVSGNRNASSSIAGRLESPKELPPKSQLISLNPIRITTQKPVDQFQLQDKNTSPTTHRFNNSPVLQQKSPKFVPYEPYRGAIRSMSGESNKTHSRKESTGSSASGSSAINCLVPQATEIKSTDDLKPTLHMPQPVPIKQKSYLQTQNHSETLLRERLKIQEKDITELQSENARLKKLLVDSMSGSRQVLQTHELGLDPFNANPSNSCSISESFDNLGVEIEVWRSKFLSSCVLVEQLTKENHILKSNDKTAAQLFQDIKNQTTLTPELYEHINYWLHHKSSFRAEFIVGANNNLLEKDSGY